MKTANNMKILYNDQIFSMMTQGGITRLYPFTGGGGGDMAE
jgi:hypothetical protein